jgi:hypothetical protein
LLAIVSAVVQSAPYAGVPVVTYAENGFAETVGVLTIGLLFGGALAIAQGIHAAWFGERLLRSRSQLISTMRSGHVVLSGVVEPAWSVLKSPFSRRLSVWYDAKITEGSGKGKHTVFRERNAVPFILNDGTGRVLVFGRRARFDPGTSLLDLHGYDRAIAEGDTSGQVAGLLGERRLLPPPEPLALHDGRKPGREGLGSESDDVIAVGERVTVIGRAAPDDRAVRPVDACIDDGASFGLPSLFRIGREPLWGLEVTAGSPRDVTVRGRLRLIVGLLGVLMLVAAGASAALIATNHVLPPYGSVVFGTSFDSWSGIQGQATTLSPLQPIAAVARFNGDVDNGDGITVRVDGYTVASWTASGGKGGPSACEIDFPVGDLALGEHRVDVLDANETELASGTVTVGN